MEHSLKSQPVDNQQAVDNQLVNSQNLMQVFEKLDNRCSALREVAGMTERLQEKLNRTQGQPKDPSTLEKEDLTERNIIELFDLIAEKMAVEIDIIGNNTENSMAMID